jgi:hypothetical protein
MKVPLPRKFFPENTSAIIEITTGEIQKVAGTLLTGVCLVNIALLGGHLAPFPVRRPTGRSKQRG